MRFEIATASLLASTAAAWSDSSPFVLFSTSELPYTLPKTTQLRSKSQVLEATRDVLASCPTDHYVLISQPDVHASDLRHPTTGKCLSPELCRGATGASVRGGFNIAEVVSGSGGSGGEGVDRSELDAYIREACAGRKNEGGLVVDHYDLTALPADRDARSAQLAQNDQKIGSILSDATKDSTVIYFSPRNLNEEKQTYEYDDPSASLQMELRRRTGDVVIGSRAAAGDSSSAPLFVKYQFFTPGIFMGLISTLIMLAILYVGLSAVSSLQVSYGAFDKEMGPAAQKKNN
ncbi:hypothetical protein VPNG_02426 [Cytospora leucostoma]|uniref:Protein BIG1 n=1 Tax=Cytospora leucostoma TaxID=1230097 RepID=A0A423XGT8_9PEZI|nr:hypothetical protein VPNG_02426 [Cytospora leucostoma]